MPPILLLKGDKNFYGSIKPEGPKIEDNSLKGDKPALPPNPMTNTALTTKLSRNIGTNILENQINNPDANTNKKYIQEENLIQSKERKLDQYQKQDDQSIGQRLTNFLQTPIVEVSEETKKTQRERERERIGIGAEPIKNEIRPVGEIPQKVIIEPAIEAGQRVIEFTEDKIFKLILLLGGIYIAGEFIKRPIS